MQVVITTTPRRHIAHSSLTEEDISEIEFTHAQRVFHHFDMTDLRDYHNFCLLTNVLLLAVVFENFRDMRLQHYGVDPAHNYTSSGLSWQAFLKMTEVELDLLTDIDNISSLRKGSGEGRQQLVTNTLEPTSLVWKTTMSANAIAT